MSDRLHTLFSTDYYERDAFLSRVFGIFSEQIVRIWCTCKDAPYGDLGRPTVRLDSLEQRSTLDFTFKARTTGKVYVGEMKCELAFEHYRYLTLEAPAQVSHHTGRAFQHFLAIAKTPQVAQVQVKSQPYTVDGAILVWGRCTEQGRKSVIDTYGMHNVLSLEDMITDLLTWQNEDFTNLLDTRAAWCAELFSGLRG